MDTNPYSAPSSSVDSPTEPQNFELHSPRTVSFGRGISWIGEGFGHFKQNPGSWILICIVGFVIMIALSIIPFLSIVLLLFTYVWIGGLMLGCKAQDDGESIQVGHLFAGWQSKVGPLILLGLVFLICYLVIMVAAMGSLFSQMMGISLNGGGAEDFNALMAEDMLSTMVLPILIASLFMIPLTMLLWFAPALIVLNDVPVFKAMGMSFMGCLKNILPFLLYSIIMFFLYILSLLPIFLGLLVFIPTAFGSIYRSYKDIYIDV